MNKSSAIALFFKGWLRSYVGLGPNFAFVWLKNKSPYVSKHVSKFAVGLAVKTTSINPHLLNPGKTSGDLPLALAWVINSNKRR